MELKEFKYNDGATSELRTFSTNKKDAAYTFLILPAMGVWAKFYDQLGEAICAEGYDVIIQDWRGLGSSSVRASRKVDFGYEDLIQDTYLLIWKLINEGKKIIILGHSLGGQIGALISARYSLRVEKLIMVAACNVHYKGWSGFTKFGSIVAGLFSYPISKIFGYFPGNAIGFGDREAMGVIRDWSRNIRTGRYDINNAYFYYNHALLSLDKPTLAITIEKDKLAPKQAMKNLYSKFANQKNIKHIHLPNNVVSNVKLDHFNWAKHPEIILKEINIWI